MEDSFHKKTIEFIENYNEFISNCYEYGMNCFEIFIGYLGNNVSSYNKAKDVNIDTFNAFMSGYQKARTDLGLSDKKQENGEIIKEPSDIYF